MTANMYMNRYRLDEWFYPSINDLPVKQKLLTHISLHGSINYVEQ